MPDDRPRPQYGEYATPEQQAAAMGKHYVPPIPPPLPETRVNLAPPRAGGQAADGQTAGGQAPAEPLRIPGNAADRFATIFQLGIGVVFLINSNFFQLGQLLNSSMASLGESNRFSLTIDHYAWVLLLVNSVLLILTAVWAYRRIRQDKLAFFVPVIGLAAFSLCAGVFTTLFAR
jgi:hypothetical protein